MNAGLLAIKLVPLLLVCSLGPGLLIVRNLKWSPLEKLCGAMAASFILTYLAGFGLFYFDAPAGAYWATSIVFAVVGLLNWKQMAVFLRRSASRSAIFAFVAVMSWDFLHLAIARHLGGGGWGGDWNEHYQRTQYFLHQIPNDYLYLGRYTLPARPPMMNLITAFYCRQVGLSFEAYSLASLFLNAFAFLPCCLLLGHLGRRASRCIPILAILFMLNPSIVQNATYTWTKAFTAAYVILGVCFYLRGLRSKGGGRIVAAALSLAAGLLVHYSALPFVIALAVHYGWMLMTQRRRATEAVAAGLSAAALLATWVSWSISVFGLWPTLFSNTTSIGTVHQSTMQTISKLMYNGFASIVPHPLYHAPPLWFHALSSWADVRDYYFLMSQTTLPMMIGCTGGLVATYLLIRFFLCGDPKLRMEKHFWMLFLAISLALAIAANPSPVAYGAAHVTLQPLALMGVTLLAAWLPRINPVLFWVVVVGAAIDYSLGIFLHFERRSLIFAPVGNPDVWLNKMLNNEQGVDAQQYGVKLMLKLTFWGDHFAAVSDLLKTASVAIAGWALFSLIRIRAACCGSPKRKLS